MRNNVPSGYKFTWTFNFTNEDWADIKHVKGGMADFKEKVKCTVGAKNTECKVDLMPQESLAFVLEPLYSNYFSYSQDYSSL
mmetsp:Transcript_3792/g.4357  ORF Transcript_3792/g.4357 Transcript_3792/m.4357 type:complete len:82 (+) Transcript_3792:1729-1974(+)